jgi:uncharacterized protein YdaU (DUF1376 family)
VTELPYMPLWVNDYLGKTGTLTMEQSGAYLHLLMVMWNNGGSLPADHRKLAWLCRMSPVRWKRVIWPALNPFFTKVDLDGGGVLQNKRLSEELQKTRKIRAQKQAAANAKWLKHKKANGAGASAIHTQSLSIRRSQLFKGREKP